MKPRETRRKVFWKILRPPDRPNWEASPVLKSLTIFIAVWLHVLPKSSLIVSHSVKATKLHKAFQYIQTVGLFFSFFFLQATENNCTFQAGFENAALCVSHSLTVSQHWEENQRCLRSRGTVCLIMRSQCLLHTLCACDISIMYMFLQKFLNCVCAFICVHPSLKHYMRVGDYKNDSLFCECATEFLKLDLGMLSL